MPSRIFRIHDYNDYFKSVCDNIAASRATRSQSVTSLISEGLATAHFIFAQCLFLGQGVTKDVDKAAIEYTKVA